MLHTEFDKIVASYRFDREFTTYVPFRDDYELLNAAISSNAYGLQMPQYRKRVVVTATTAREMRHQTGVTLAILPAYSRLK